jgi:hypothetical protein
MIVSGARTAAYEAIELLTARTAPHQQGYRDTFALEKAGILRRWGQHTASADVLEEIVVRNAHQTSQWYGHFVEAHLLLAEIRAHQGREADARHSFEEILRCPLDPETRAEIARQSKILLEPGYMPDDEETHVIR